MYTDFTKDVCSVKGAVFLLTTFLLSSVSTVNIASESNLIDAARDQDWTLVQSLLKVRGTDVNVTEPDGTTALFHAVYRDNVESVKALLDKGANPNMANDYGITPMSLAMENHSLPMVKLLLEEGADANAANWSGESLLMTSARTGFTEAMKLLLDHGADVNFQDLRRNQSALMWAISFGYPDAAKFLIDRGADVNTSTIQLKENFTPLQLEGYEGSTVTTLPMGGYTPLLFAARNGDMETSKYLVDRGANVNAVSQTDGNPLLMAASQGYEDLALYFLTKGADPNVTDENGMTSLHYAMRTGIRALHGLYTTDKDLYCNFGGENFLCRPYETLNEQQREYVASPEAEVYLVKPKLYDRSKPLPGPNMLKLASALIDAGADPNAKMKYPPAALRLERNPWFSMNNATPFFLAAASQDLDAISILLEEGAEPIMTTEMPRELFSAQSALPAEDNSVVGNATTLMAAVGMGRRADMTINEEENAVKIAEILISQGADVNESTESGWTALHAAAFLGSDMLIKLLVENGADIDATTACGRTPISLALADSTEGMLDRTLPRIDTANLLLDLGAGLKPPSPPVGYCIGGRGGLENDTAQNQLVLDAIKVVNQRLEERKAKWQDQASL